MVRKLSKKEVKELEQKSDAELKINEAVFLLRRKVKELEERLFNLETCG